jgi:uncharacterized membrane protein (UPF0182 family)
LAIPVSDTFIYVEPVYLEAMQEKSESAAAGPPQPRGFARPQSRGAPPSSQPDKSRAAALPELKRVIASFGNRLIMEENLDKALSRVVGGQIFPKQSVSPSIPQTQDMSSLGVLALKHYNKAKDYLRKGNWAEYGRELENLEKVLKEMSGIGEERK